MSLEWKSICLCGVVSCKTCRLKLVNVISSFSSILYLLLCGVQTRKLTKEKWGFQVLYCLTFKRQPQPHKMVMNCRRIVWVCLTISWGCALKELNNESKEILFSWLIWKNCNFSNTENYLVTRWPNHTGASVEPNKHGWQKLSKICFYHANRGNGVY